MVGAALRLAHTLSGSAPGFLQGAPLGVGDRVLRLTLPDDGSIYSGEAVERRLRRLARAAGLGKGKVVAGS